MGIRDRLAHAWNVFTQKEEVASGYRGGAMYGNRDPSRPRLSIGNDRSIISSILTRLSVDASTVDIKHVRLDSEGRYIEDIPSFFNDCLTFEANVDQASQFFHRDFFLTMLDKGVAAAVPIDTTMDPRQTGGFDIKTMRVGGGR